MLWQESDAAVEIGVLKGSSLLMDEIKSELNQQIIEQVKLCLSTIDTFEMKIVQFFICYCSSNRSKVGTIHILICMRLIMPVMADLNFLRN